MSGFWFFISAICFAGAAVGMLAVWAQKYNKKKIIKGIIWGFLVFLTCFDFPLSSERFPLRWTDIVTYVSICSFTAAGLYGTYGEDQGPMLFPRLVLFTAIGMICRYLLEFGEVSNTYNFTLVNILVYLFATPVVTLLAYEFVDKTKYKKE